MPIMILSLVNIVESCVRAERLWNLDAVTLLVILKESSYDTWKRERATVESMCKICLTICILISELKTVSLI